MGEGTADEVAGAVGPRRLDDDGDFYIAAKIVGVFGYHPFAVGQNSPVKDAVGVRSMNDLVRRDLFNPLDDGLGQPLAELPAKAIGLEHRHEDRADVGSIERTGAELIGGAAGEKAKDQ